MPAKTFDDFQKRVDQWMLDMLKDDEKMQAWVDKHVIKNKENALDELFGVK